MSNDEQKPRSDDWDGEPIPMLPDIQVQDTPTIVLLPNGRSWRRRIGFMPESKRDA